MLYSELITECLLIAKDYEYIMAINAMVAGAQQLSEVRDARNTLAVLVAGLLPSFFAAWWFAKKNEQQTVWVVPILFLMFVAPAYFYYNFTLLPKAQEEAVEAKAEWLKLDEEYTPIAELTKECSAGGRGSLTESDRRVVTLKLVSNIDQSVIEQKLITKENPIK
ncbi:MAG: hypothetical protein VYA60_04650 [Pseudomonadota bacterium]|nr:hypothetical protein [Pseudomonadota bacterium]